MRRTQNLGRLERWVRILGGGILALVGFLLLVAGPSSVVAGVAEGVLVLLGLDFVVTGITGYCPLYRRLGWSTARARPEQEGP